MKIQYCAHTQHSQCSQLNTVLETVSRAVLLRSCRWDSFQRPVRLASDRMIFYMVPISHTLYKVAPATPNTFRRAPNMLKTPYCTFI